MTGPCAWLEGFNSCLEADLLLLQRLVEMESGSSDKEGINRLADYMAREFAARGAEAEVHTLGECGHGLRAVWRGRGMGRPVLFLGHLDTVWPPGTVAARPFVRRDSKAYGPGVYDMKGGLLLCLMVCGALCGRQLRLDGDVIFLFTPDEETGSACGRAWLEAEAAPCRAVLCLEPPLPGGGAKTFRKGVGTFRLRVLGIEAHAGTEPEKGANAIVELSRQVLRLQRMSDADRGTTVSVGLMRGGSAVNVIPGCAEAEVDFRFPAVADGKRLARRIAGLQPLDARCRLEIEGGINRPPLERSPAVVELYSRARAVAASIGMTLDEGGTGGGSDGSFTAALGVPTLDGLGVEGGGAHAIHEHVLIPDIPRRAALLALLVQELLR